MTGLQIPRRRLLSDAFRLPPIRLKICLLLRCPACFRLRGGAKSTVKVGLFYSEWVDQWCSGLIGGEGKNRICCKAIGQCTTKLHKLNKGIVRNKHFHICGIKENQMLIEPRLDGESLSKIELNDLINDQRESNVWIAYFEEKRTMRDQVLKHYDGTDNTAEWEEVEMTSLKEISAANEAYRTPHKLKHGSFLATTMNSLATGSPMEARTFVKVENVNSNVDEPTREDMSKGLLDMLKQWIVLAENLEVIHTDLSSTNKRDVRFKEELVDTFLRVETKIKETDTRMKLLISGVGSDNPASKRGSNRVWTSIKLLQEDMRALETQMTLMYERLAGGTDESLRIEKLEFAREIGPKRGTRWVGGAGEGPRNKAKSAQCKL
jgi:hypothetical protein